MSMQVDRVDRRKIYWSGNYINPNSNEYRLLENEANYAVSSKKMNMTMTFLMQHFP